MKVKTAVVLLSSGVASFAAFAEWMDRPGGIKVGERMKINPYVSVSYSFDSNVDSARKEYRSHSLVIDPGLSFVYNAERWNLTGSLYLNYHQNFGDYSDELSNLGFGESLGWSYSGMDDGRGWSATIRESYSKVLQDDDASNNEGRGVWRDRGQFTLSAALNRRFNDQWHAGVNFGTYYLDYDNDQRKYAPLYGWSRFTAGANVGYTMSRWTDFFLSGSYSGYLQDNDKDLGDPYGNVYDVGDVSGDSKGWSLHGGIGTYLTERITYRLSAGWSHFEYGGVKDSDGFTYEANFRWQAAERWNVMLLAASYYSPSEREYASSTRNDTISLGVARGLIRGKLNATADINYRHETHECVSYDTADYNLDIITGRVGLSYTLNRYLSINGNIEYQTEINDGSAIHNSYNYDRWRGNIGLRFAY